MSATGIFPGQELVDQGLADLNAGLVTVEACLLIRFRERLAASGIDLPPTPASMGSPELHMYRLIAETRRNGAHSAYNALTRRLVSYLRARERAARRDG